MMKLPVAYNETGLAIVDTHTGELVPLAEASETALAGLVASVDDYAAELRRVKDALTGELLDRMGSDRHLNTGTHEVERVTRRDWDKRATWQALEELNKTGVISQRELDDAMPERTERKPDGRKLNALLVRLAGDDPTTATALAQAREERAYVKVTRSTAVDGSAEELAA